MGNKENACKLHSDCPITKSYHKWLVKEVGPNPTRQKVEAALKRFNISELTPALIKEAGYDPTSREVEDP